MTFEEFLKFLSEEFEFDTEGIEKSTTFEEINFDGGGGGGKLKPWIAGAILRRRREYDNAKSRFTLALRNRELIQLQ